MKARKNPCLLKAQSHGRSFGFESPRGALGDVSDGAEDADLREQEKPLLKPKMKPPHFASGKFTLTQHNGIQGPGKLTSSGHCLQQTWQIFASAMASQSDAALIFHGKKKTKTLLLKELSILGSSQLLQQPQAAVTAELPMASPSKTSALNRHKKMLGNFPTEVRVPTQCFRSGRAAKQFELQKEAKKWHYASNWRHIWRMAKLYGRSWGAELQSKLFLFILKSQSVWELDSLI